MRLLLDSCAASNTLKALLSVDHDVRWVGELGKDPGDEEVIELAYQENRVLITLDKDFGELAIIKGKPHCGIVRLVNMSTKGQASASILILKQHQKDLEQGAIITAERGRLRIRQPSR